MFNNHIVIGMVMVFVLFLICAMALINLYNQKQDDGEMQEYVVSTDSVFKSNVVTHEVITYIPTATSIQHKPDWMVRQEEYRIWCENNRALKALERRVAS